MLFDSPPPAVGAFKRAPLLALFTDFGLAGPYVGQMKIALLAHASTCPVVDLMHDAPACNPRAAAYLLAALAPRVPEGGVVVGVVDPGVGSIRTPVALQADGRWWVGPGNGLFDIVARRARTTTWWRIVWQPPALSASFHGRDLFAPVAAKLAAGTSASNTLASLPPPVNTWPEDLAEVIYIDAYGNAMTGLRAACVPNFTAVHLAGHRVARARAFSDVPLGTLLCYENSIGLIEIAAHGASAAAQLALTVGMVVKALE